MSAMLARLSAENKKLVPMLQSAAAFCRGVYRLWMGAISCRLVYLQVTQHNHLGDRARGQQQVEVETAAQRGVLLDRQERELARSIKTESIFVDPKTLDESGDVKCTANRLAAVLRLEEKSLLRQLEEAKKKGSRFTWIARRVSFEQAEQVRGLGLPGVNFQAESKRFYPNGSLAAHVLGFVGLDGAGLAGVEQFQNAKMNGEPGKLLVENDSDEKSYESFESAGRNPGRRLF